MSRLSECFLSEADALFAAYPTMNAEWRNRSDFSEVTIRASDASGFDIRVLADTRELIVYVDGAETRYCALNSAHVPSVVHDAMEFIRCLLSPATRLRTQFAGGRAYKWIVEHDTGDSWVPGLRSRLLFWNYLGHRSETIRQNHHLLAVPKEP
jgi:hypothetical protein